MRETYDEMMAHCRETVALSQISGILSWDQETMMPKGAAHQRSEWMGALESTLHARETDPRIGDWLAALCGADLGQEAAANIRHIDHAHARAIRVPADLAVEIARVTSVSQGVWARARAEGDFAAFAPTLQRVLELHRQKAVALSDGSDPYDALLDAFEPGATAAGLTTLFAGLRAGLTDLLARIRDTGQGAPALDFQFDVDLQKGLADELAGAFGYDWSRGRLDAAVHPFSSGSGDDVRITTRFDPRDPFNCIYSTIHETGHATYEQNIRHAYSGTPLGRGVSMGVHESQSRIYENQLGRSRAFCGWLFQRMQAVFGDFGVHDPETFYRLVNAVKPGCIRTEADEVQYNLHILMRFDLERALIAGDLDVADLEGTWNERFLADFGTPVDGPANGVLQDVHWSVGLFGYFPTYTLGNIHAAGLFEAMNRAVPDLDAQLTRGDTAAARGWLGDNVHRFGGLFEPRDLIERATGQATSEGPLLAYLNAKFGALYGV